MGSANFSEEEKNEWKQEIRKEINGASDQFIDDFYLIYKTHNNQFIKRVLDSCLVSKIYSFKDLTIYIIGPMEINFQKSADDDQEKANNF